MHLILLLILQIPASGLQPGERVVELAPALDVSSLPAERRAFCRGRLLDAMTGRPIAGATVETWTEEINATFGGFHRLGVTSTGVDGRFVVRRRVGSCTSGKVRIAAPGYLTWSGTTGDLDEARLLFPAHENAPQLRVLDLAGRPIAGARITSTYSCSHDVPAFDVSTDAVGIARLPAFGLQDDVPDLRVRAPGFAQIESANAIDGFFLQPPRAGPLDVYLARNRPVAFRLLDRDGEVAVDAPLYVLDGDAYHIVRTDEQGIARILDRQSCGELSVHVLATPEHGYITQFTPPVGRVPSLRPFADQWPPATATGTVSFDWGERDAPWIATPVQLFSKAGWAYPAGPDRDEELTFPAGVGYAVIGAPFSGHAQELLEFEIVANEKTVLKPALVAEPTVRFELPDPEGWSLTVEVGSHSRSQVPFGEEVAVPGHAPMFLLLEGARGPLRMRLPPAVGDTRVDLSALVRSAPVPAKVEVGVQVFRFVDEVTGSVLRGVLSLARPAACELGLADGPELAIRGPVGAAWLACFKAEGHAPIWVRGRVVAGGPPREYRVPAYASLEIEAPFDYVIEGGGALDLEHLAPGPLELVLHDEHRRRIGIALELAPGARRRIEIE